MPRTRFCISSSRSRSACAAPSTRSAPGASASRWIASSPRSASIVSRSFGSRTAIPYLLVFAFASAKPTGAPPPASRPASRGREGGDPDRAGAERAARVVRDELLVDVEAADRGRRRGGPDGDPRPDDGPAAAEEGQAARGHVDLDPRPHLRHRQARGTYVARGAVRAHRELDVVPGRPARAPDDLPEDSEDRRNAVHVLEPETRERRAAGPAIGPDRALHDPGVGEALGAEAPQPPLAGARLPGRRRRRLRGRRPSGLP